MPSGIVYVNGEKAVCRYHLSAMSGLYEQDAVRETFGVGACELDCEGCAHKAEQQESYIDFLLEAGIIRPKVNGSSSRQGLTETFLGRKSDA